MSTENVVATVTSTAIGSVVLTGEKADKKTVIDGKVATVSLTVKADKEGSSRYVEWIFNCAGMEDKDLMAYAVRSMVIDAQRLYRNADEKDRKDLYDHIFNMPEALKVERKGRVVDPKKQALNALSKMSKEERLSLIAELTKDDEANAEVEADIAEQATA